MIVLVKDGNVLAGDEVLSPSQARALAQVLLCAAENAQSYRSRRGDGMPERVATEEMRGIK